MSRGRPDLVILDVMLPGIGGFEVLSRIRENSRVPVIMLTARGEEVDRIVGLEWGPTTISRSRSIRASWWLDFGPSFGGLRGLPRPAMMWLVAIDDLEIDIGSRRVRCSSTGSISPVPSSLSSRP